MATIIGNRIWTPRPLAPDAYERGLAAGAVLLLVAVALAMARGQAHWADVPIIVWLHLATIAVALALTPVMMLRRRGDARHRRLGTIWVMAMMATAMLSLGIRSTSASGYSVIHLLSLFTLVQVPIIWWSARTHRVALHRRSVRGMVTGALLVAGFFTFPFHRLLGTWLFG